MRDSDSSDLEPDTVGRLHASMAKEIQDLMMSSDNDNETIGAPPAHLAARLYRCSASRRKSSTSSSRRNSMSSHHSGRSSRSAHGGPRSTHIAQHLRRASIIESRKARLADRAAHAEQVRLRAATAKAAPRCSTSSEERALAAKHARERYLAQVTATCAEQVNRAKRVAEDTREKKAAQHLKLKGNMEERLAEAERRRSLLQQHQRRPRGQTLPSVEEKKVLPSIWRPRNDAEAACIIQKAWRGWKRKQILFTFTQLGLTLENIQKSSFEEVSTLLAEEKVLESTSKVLSLYGLQPETAGNSADKAAVRTFLSAFLILGHPTQVLSEESEQEKDLIERAKNLLLAFNQVISSTLSPPPGTHLTLLHESYTSFQTAFTAWKDQDSTLLIETMLAQFVELDAILQTVKDDREGNVAADYQEGIQNNQTLLLVRLKRLAGAERAMKMVKEAIKKNRKAKANTKRVGDIKPRAATTTTASTATGQVSLDSIDGTIPGPSRRPFIDHKPASFLPDNRTIVHELAINKNYRIDIAPETSSKEDMIRLVSEKMKIGIESGFGEIFTVAMAECVKEKLLGLVTPGKSLHVLISESLDTPMIANQLRMGAFSYQQFFNFMNSLLPQMCAPVRDAEVKAYTEDENEDPIERLAKLYYIIDLLSIDHANFLLQKNAPMLIEEAARYENKCFGNALDGQPLLRTSQWWRNASDSAYEEVERRAASTNPSSQRITAETIYMQGLTNTVIAVDKLKGDDIPETLELDRKRIECMRRNVHRMIIVAAILLTAKNLMRRDVRSIWKEQAQRMWDLPFDESQNFISVVESRYALPPTTKTQLSGTVERILLDARDRQATHPVVKILLKKMKAHVSSRLSAASAEERAKVASSATQVLSSNGLTEFVTQIGAMVDELKRVADVDREAHGQWYEEVAANSNSR